MLYMIVEKCVCAGEKVRKMGYECKDTYVADINYLILDGRVFVIYLNVIVVFFLIVREATPMIPQRYQSLYLHIFRKRD